MALMASSSRSGNALKNFATFTAASHLRDAWEECESLIACCNASLLCVGDELVSEHKHEMGCGGRGGWVRGVD
jgi:hypothetical protein